MPDAALFARAESGELADEAVLGAEVDRMLADAKALDSIPMFHLQWLGVSEKEDTEVERARRAETARFSDFVVRRGDGLLVDALHRELFVPGRAALRRLRHDAAAGLHRR